MTKMKVSVRHALWMFSLGVIFYLYEFLLRVAPNPMFANLMRDFHIEAAALGILFSSYLLPYAFFQPPLGALMDRLGPRRLLTGAVILCAVSTLYFSQTQSFAMVCLARFCIGAGSAFAFVSCVKIVRLWLPPRFFPVLTGLILTVGNIGAVLGVALLSTALEWMHWRSLFFILGIVGIVLGVLVWFGVKDGPLEKNGSVFEDFWSNMKTVMKIPQVWYLAGINLLSTAPTDAFGGLWGTPFLVQVHGIERHAASIAVSMTFVGVAIGSPLMGWLSNVWQSRRKPIWIGSFLATISLLLIIYSPLLNAWTAALLFLCFGIFGNYVMSFVILGDTMPDRLIASAIGFVNGMAMLGSSVLTASIGFILGWMEADQRQNGVSIYSVSDYHVALSLLPLFYLLALGLVFWRVKESFPASDA
jgi:MFS family permease